MKILKIIMILIISTHISAYADFKRCNLGNGSMIQIGSYDWNAVGLDLYAYDSMDLPIKIGNAFAELGIIKSFEQVQSLNIYLNSCKKSGTLQFSCSNPGNTYVQLLLRYRDSQGLFNERFINTTPFIEGDLSPGANQSTLTLNMEYKGKFSRVEFPIFCN